MSNLTQAGLTQEQRTLLRSMGECDKPELIKRLLRHHGLTQAGVARKHNVPFSSINQAIEHQRPNRDARAIVSQELGFPEAVLFDPWPARQRGTSMPSEAAA